MKHIWPALFLLTACGETSEEKTARLAASAEEAGRKADEMEARLREAGVEGYEDAYNDPRINAWEFNQLSNGMSYEQAAEIIGSQGELVSESTMQGAVTRMYMWKGEASAGANANAMFQNDRLISKAQFGL